MYEKVKHFEELEEGFGYIAHEVDTSQGQSGAPLMVKKADSYVIYGVHAGVHKLDGVGDYPEDFYIASAITYKILHDFIRPNISKFMELYQD